METSLTPAAAAALFAAMAVLAAVPGVSVMAVVARSASGGFAQGALAALGIVVGDVLFILLAVFGLMLLVESLGELFVLVKILGAGYLFWLGVTLWRAGDARPAERDPRAGGGVSSFMSGLLITLADQKAILFYLGFLPAFMDLGAVTPADTGLLALIAVVSVGGVKLLYAALADRAGRRLDARATRWINRLAGALLVAAGAALALRIA